MMIGQEKLEKAFFSLLRAGLWEREPDELSIFPLTRDEWWNVFVMTRKQTVTALVYQGICMMPEALFPPQDILLKWVAAVDAIGAVDMPRFRTYDVRLLGTCISSGTDG